MRMKFFLTLSFLALFALAAFGQEKNLEWNETTHDFGTIEQGDPGKTVFKFTNKMDHPIKLDKVKASCGCTTPKWTREEIAPGADGEIEVSYNTNRIGGFNKAVRIWYDSLPNPDVIYIKGNVNAKPADPNFQPAPGNKVGQQQATVDPIQQKKQQYTIPRGKLAFKKMVHTVNEITNNDKKTVVFEFMNTSNTPVKILPQIEADPEFTVTPDLWQLVPNQEGKITVVVDGSKITGSGGFFSKRIKIMTDEEGLNNTKQITISGNFKRVLTEEEKKNSPKIAFVTKDIDGGKIIEGEKWVYDFKFKNEGKTNLVIESAKASCGCTASAAKDTDIAPGQESYITATFNSKGRLGKQSKTITVKSNDVNNPTVTLKFTVEVEKDPFHAGGIGPANE